MKVLKSGIEIDPSDLSKIKGGACACGCDIGMSSSTLSNTSTTTLEDCLCGCDPSNPEGVGDMGRAAAIQIKPPVN